MIVQDVLSQAKDALTVKRVFGEPYEKDGVTVIPAAAIAGGGGGGQGDKSDGQQSGGGFGVGAKPAGVYVLKDGEVRWQPALDLNRVILGGQLVMIVLLFTLRAIVKARTSRQ